MALKKCYECGHDVSTKAEKCPSCGAPNPTNSAEDIKPKSKYSIWLIAIVCVICVIGLFTLLRIYSGPSAAFKTAMTSDDCSEVREAIKTINNPEQLFKICDRCERKSDSSKTGREGLCWVYAGLESIARIKE